MKTNLYSGITIVGRDSNEWHRMWEALGKHKATRPVGQVA